MEYKLGMRTGRCSFFSFFFPFLAQQGWLLAIIPEMISQSIMKSSFKDWKDYEAANLIRSYNHTQQYLSKSFCSVKVQLTLPSRWVGLVLVKCFEGDELAHVRGGQRRWTSGLVVGEKVQHLVQIWKLCRKGGNWRLTFSQHIFEDDIDAAVVGIVVAFKLHSVGQFLVSWMAQVSLVNDAWKYQAVYNEIFTQGELFHIWNILVHLL